MNTLQSQETIVKVVEIEDEILKSPTSRRALMRTLTNEPKKSNFTQSYTEYFSKDVLFATNFNANKPKKLFVNSVLLGKIDETYQNIFIKCLSHGNVYATTDYFIESFANIKSNIDLFTQQLREATIKAVISFNEYEALIYTFKKISQRIERAKVEFALRESREKYFVRLS